jgi:hypothetical protein
MTTTQQLLDAYLSAHSAYTTALLDQSDQGDRRSGAMGIEADENSHREADVDVAGPHAKSEAALVALRQHLTDRGATEALEALSGYADVNHTTKTGPAALQRLRDAVSKVN